MSGDVRDLGVDMVEMAGYDVQRVVMGQCSDQYR
jgi:hypothetical protein